MGLFSGSSNSSVTGYNCEQVNALRDVINNTAQEAGKGIVDRLHNEIITPMSTAWYAPEAQEFFEGFAETVKESGTNIQEAFDSFRDAVEKAGASWAENTGGEQPSLPTIDDVDLTLSVSEIQASNNGDVTINSDEANAVANSLSQVEEEIKSDLESLAAKLDAASAFIGGGQASALQECFVTVSGEIHKIFKYLTEGEATDNGHDGSLKGQITYAVQKYTDVSENISNSFNSTQE